MNSYRPRNISFSEVCTISDWKVKIYTISKIDNYTNKKAYDIALTNLPDWLSEENSFNADHSLHAFLLLHEGTEGVFAIVNWWVDGNMLNTNIYLTEHGDRPKFVKISGDGLAPCVWELEVICHEKTVWWKQVVMKPDEPNYLAYIKSVINKKI